jgi:hypothetical protein
MAVEAITDAEVVIGRYAMGGYLNNCVLEYGAEMLDATVYKTNGTRKNVAGLLTGRLSVVGFTDWALNGGSATLDSLQDAIYHPTTPIFGPGSPAYQPITVMAKDGDGEVAWSIAAVISRFLAMGEIGVLTPWEMDTEQGRRVFRGTNMVSGQKTSAGNGTARQLGAVPAGSLLLASLHVHEFTGTDVTFTLESDDAGGFATPTTQHTFTQLTAPGEEWAEVAAPITDDYWRLAWTGTFTSFTAVCNVGIITLR